MGVGAPIRFCKGVAACNGPAESFNAYIPRRPLGRRQRCRAMLALGDPSLRHGVR